METILNIETQTHAYIDPYKMLWYQIIHHEKWMDDWNDQP